jgi:hypothetical protein
MPSAIARLATTNAPMHATETAAIRNVIPPLRLLLFAGQFAMN